MVFRHKPHLIIFNRLNLLFYLYLSCVLKIKGFCDTEYGNLVLNYGLIIPDVGKSVTVYVIDVPDYVKLVSIFSSVADLNREITEIECQVAK